MNFSVEFLGLWTASKDDWKTLGANVNRAMHVKLLVRNTETGNLGHNKTFISTGTIHAGAATKNTSRGCGCCLEERKYWKVP